MTPLHKSIEMFGVAADDHRLVRLVGVRKCCRMRATLLDGDLLRQSLMAHALG